MKQKQPRDLLSAERKRAGLSYDGILSSVFAIVLGLIVGLIILFLCNPAQALPGFATILTGAFTHGAKGIGQVFYYATPIILTGLSVGFAFKTGLFNIGTPGQFIMGAVWGLVPGLLKAYYNVNEVIASIMMNYIGMYLVNWIVKSSKPLFNNLRNESRNVAATANIPKMGLDKIFPGSSVNGGIIIAIIVVILIYLLLNKTTFGYELKAVGFNRDASKYAGINEKKSIIMSMMIAGAIAGLAGGLLYLAGTGKHIEIKDVLASEGFTGISVALLGLSNPIGVLFSGIFIAYLTAGGFYLQLFEFSTEIIDIIVAVIIYFSAFALMVKMLIGKVQKARHEKEEAQTKGGGDA